MFEAGRYISRVPGRDTKHLTGSDFSCISMLFGIYRCRSLVFVTIMALPMITLEVSQSTISSWRPFFIRRTMKNGQGTRDYFLHPFLLLFRTCFALLPCPSFSLFLPSFSTLPFSSHRSLHHVHHRLVPRRPLLPWWVHPLSTPRPCSNQLSYSLRPTVNPGTQPPLAHFSSLWGTYRPTLSLRDNPHFLDSDSLHLATTKQDTTCSLADLRITASSKEIKDSTSFRVRT